MAMTRGSRRNRKRRLMADINVVPYIDVMLVLLIIFMVTAPLLNVGVDVNLPDANAKTLEQSRKQPLVVQVSRDGSLALLVEGDARPRGMPQAALLAQVAALIAADPSLPVYVAGDADVSYQTVYALMGQLQSQANVTRVSLMGSLPSASEGK